MENEDVIRERMEKTRESLSQKLETLEDKLLGSVEDTKSAVRETVAQVKETMHEGVETVKDAVDIEAHVDRRPWLMFGGAVLGGYILGSLLMRDSTPAPAAAIATTPPKEPAPGTRRHTTGNGHHKPAAPKPQPAAPAQPAEAEPESILHAFEPELRQLKGLALGVAAGTVREMLTKQMPPHLADEIRSIVDGVTRKMGGEPVAGSDLPFTESASCQTEQSSSPFEADKPRW
jgi:ElaB/YqjD/DUF883 family membrane-anchored ribosome-binding protein